MVLCAVDWNGLVRPLWILGAAVAASIVVDIILSLVMRQMSKRLEKIPPGSLNKRLRWPARLIVLVFAVRFVLPALEMSEKASEMTEHSLSLLLIAAVAWLVMKGMYVLEDCIAHEFDVTAKDNLRARKIHTQFRVLKRICILIIGTIAFATMLMTFPRVRQLGTTILASAGVIGIVVGMAAQKTIGTFIAGIQIALTQPIRLDDVVIVENEWGRIEEITLTYVVVRIWDQRRLIVPITYFIDKPFQNWTRVSADILGTVFLYVDHTVPIEAVREELQRILNESELWDKKVCVVQVTNTTEKTIEVRALMSAADASTAWSLRCLVREKLVEFVAKNYPQSLPRLRGEFESIKS
jgi:small-conductance mechanosensitive channel